MDSLAERLKASPAFQRHLNARAQVAQVVQLAPGETIQSLAQEYVINRMTLSTLFMDLAERGIYIAIPANYSVFFDFNGDVNSAALAVAAQRKMIDLLRQRA